MNKMPRIDTLFMTKTAIKNHALLGLIYLYNPYKRESNTLRLQLAVLNTSCQ